MTPVQLEMSGLASKTCWMTFFQNSRLGAQRLIVSTRHKDALWQVWQVIVHIHLIPCVLQANIRSFPSACPGNDSWILIDCNCQAKH